MSKCKICLSSKIVASNQDSLFRVAFADWDNDLNLFQVLKSIIATLDEILKSYAPIIEKIVVEEEKIPYYSNLIFLADNIDTSKIDELYVEEEIEKE